MSSKIATNYGKGDYNLDTTEGALEDEEYEAYDDFHGYSCVYTMNGENSELALVKLMELFKNLWTSQVLNGCIANRHLLRINLFVITRFIIVPKIIVYSPFLYCRV